MASMPQQYWNWTDQLNTWKKTFKQFECVYWKPGSTEL